MHQQIWHQMMHETVNVLNMFKYKSTIYTDNKKTADFYSLLI